MGPKVVGVVVGHDVVGDNVVGEPVVGVTLGEPGATVGPEVVGVVV